MANQKTPDGYYNIGRMARSSVKKGKIGACGTCMDARGLPKENLIEGIHQSSMNELADWIVANSQVITF